MALTNYLEENLLKHVLGISSFSSPSVIYVGVSTTLPNDDGTNWSELTGAGYQRSPVAFNPAVKIDSSPYGAQIASATDCYFGPAPSPNGWSGMASYGLFDARTGGNLLAYSSPQFFLSVAAARFLKLAAGAGFTVALTTGNWSTYVMQQLLDRAFRSGAFSSPTPYAALCTTSHLPPREEASGTGWNEISGGGYARVALSPWTAVAQVGAAAETKNANNVDFPVASADWQNFLGGAICSAATGGKVLSVAGATGDVNNGDTGRINSNAVVCRIA